MALTLKSVPSDLGDGISKYVRWGRYFSLVLPHPWVLSGKEQESSWCKPCHRHKGEEKLGGFGAQTLKQMIVKKHLLELLMARDADWLPQDSRESAVLGFALGT